MGLLAAVEVVGADILVLGQDRAILRFQPEVKRPGRLLFTSSTALLGFNVTVVGVAVCLLFLIGTPQAFSVPVLPHLLAIGAALILLVQIRLQLASARSGGRPAEFMAVRISYAVGKLAFVLALGILLGDARAYAFGVLGASTLAGGVALVSLVRKWEPHFDRRIGSRILSFGWPLMLHVVAGGILVFVDRFMLERLTSAADVGIYTLAYTIGGAVAFVHLTSSVWAEPEVYRHASQPRLRERMLAAYTVGNLAVGAAVGAAILLALPLAAGRIFGTAYGPLPALIPVILAAHVLNPIYIQGNWRLAAVDATGLLAFATATAALANISLNWFLIPRHGTLGAAWATFLSYVLLAGLSVVASLLRSRTHPKGFRELPYLGAAVLALCGVAFLKSLPWQVILLGGLALGGALRVKRLIGEVVAGSRNGVEDPAEIRVDKST